MSKKIIALILSTLFIISSNVAFAGEVNNSDNQEVATLILEDDSGILLASSSSRVVWSQSYNNVGSVKKDISVRNYGSAKIMRVYIKNNGSNTITLNIYKSAFLGSKSLASGNIPAGQARTYQISGINDCTTNTCFDSHDYTISVYSNYGNVSIYGSATLG